jgi:hypothetical protein
MEAFWSSIQSAPVFAGLSAIESAWPAGACSIGTYSLPSDLGGETIDYGSTFCSFWAANVATPLSVAALVMWALLGCFIFLKA